MKLFPDHPHSRFLLDVSKPARYAGAEHGMPEPRKDARLRLVLAFPDVYELGCANMGLTILYHTAHAHPRVRVERAFAPWRDYAQKLIERGELLVSYESAAPLNTFDVIGFSIQHELLFTNVLMMIRLAGLALRTEERGEGGPLIVAGGPSVSNPEPLSDFIDAFALGDGELLLPEILRVLDEGKTAGRKKRAVLEDLARVKGMYVPSLYDRRPAGRIRRAVTGAKPGAGAPLPVGYSILKKFGNTEIHDPCIAAIEPVFDRYQVEITRGCCGGCRFCHAGSVYRPARHRPPENILRGAVDGIIRTGHGALSLSSLSPADYPGLEPLVRSMEDFLVRRRILLSVSSLRSYGVTESVLRTIASVKATGITLAPEAGSQRLRNLIGKQVTDEDLSSSIELLARLGWRRVKLYFMIGLPGETDEDLEGIVETIRRSARRTGGKRRMEVSVSLSNFVPKPFTPFQWEEMAGIEKLEASRRKILALARGLRAKLDFHDVRQSAVESVLARGGSELCPVLADALEAGCMMDGWSDCFDFDLWKRALEKSGLSIESCLREIPEEEMLPWGHIRAPVAAEFLRSERAKSRRGELTPPCRASGSGDLCHGCGAHCEKAQPMETGAGLQDAARWAAERLEALERDRDVDFGENLDGKERIMLDLRFVRSGRMIYTGHRDTVRIMRHVFLRANLPLRYSSGFSPRPIINFRSALPLGVVGLNERVFVEVFRRPTALGSVLSRLKRAAHPGIRFMEAGTAGRREVKELVKGLPAVRWFVVPAGRSEEATLAAAAERIERREPIPMQRKKAGGGRNVDGAVFEALDLREFITGVRVERLRDLPEGWNDAAGAGPVLALETRPRANHAIRREEIDYILESCGLTPIWHLREIID